LFIIAPNWKNPDVHQLINKKQIMVHMCNGILPRNEKKESLENTRISETSC
jgi:hypothetical protein